MEFIKKFWKYIIGTVGFFIGLVWFMNKNTSRKVKRIKKDIKSNQKQTKEVDKKINQVKKDKEVTKKKIKKTNQDLKKIKKKKPVVKKKSGKNAATSIKNRLKKK
jgi:DNA-binding transcriptional regulator GbsR (MarR family)|tara:strand:+ start:6151 stop:6465 length:315 start_codon:yes stop_codon:yes gene_type:complete